MGTVTLFPGKQCRSAWTYGEIGWLPPIFSYDKSGYGTPSALSGRIQIPDGTKRETSCTLEACAPRKSRIHFFPGAQEFTP